MKLVKVLIADVDYHLCNAMKNVLIQNFVNIEIVAQSSSVNETVLAICECVPDVVVMDMDLTDGTAVDVVKETFHMQYRLVIMLNYNNKMLDVVRFAGIDFMYKPLDETDLLLTFDGLATDFGRGDYKIRLKALVNNVVNPEDRKIIVLNVYGILEEVPLNEIVFGKSHLSVTKFFLVNEKTIEVNQSLRRFESVLVNYGFYRCHSNYVVNNKFVKAVVYPTKQLKMEGDVLIPYEERRFDNQFKKDENIHIFHS